MRISIGPPVEYRPGRFRCLLSVEGRRGWCPTAKSPERARELAEIAAAAAQADSRTVADAIEDYLAAKKINGIRDRSVSSMRGMLRLMHGDLVDSVITAVTPAQADRAYSKRAAGVAVDTHRNELAVAKALWNWLVESKAVRRSPFADVKPFGKRNKGKPQLRLDEAKKLKRLAVERAERGRADSIAVLLALLCGLRGGEIVSRRARDLDNDGRWLWIDETDTFETKSPKAARRIDLPTDLIPLLGKLAAGKAPGDLLFPGRRGQQRKPDWVLRETHRLCALAGVPRVCAHSLRGLHATIAVVAGVVPQLVADALGHESTSTTLGNYAQPGAEDIAKRKRLIDYLN